ncbi:MAG: three-Cys-motif partner protein TcmP [Xanthomonadaceae bacterium]|nr:three-Cys-motif partner protein TcmP [Xanthomonadaceae bacterium]
MPTQKDDDRYEIDPEDGLRRAIVGDWAPEKHLRLQKYVDITRAVRRKFGGNATYIDLYCGPGRARLRKTGEVVEGSAMVAATEAIRRRNPYREVIIGDIDPVNVEACEARLKRLRVGNVRAYAGTAEDVAAKILPTLHPTGFNLAFLDPFNLESLPFQVIQTLAQAKTMDLLIHVSIMDLQRNVRALMTSGKLNSFAPGWEKKINSAATNPKLVMAAFEYWRSLLSQLGYLVSDNIERVTGNRNQPLYWLVLASKHDLADKLWGEVSQVEPQGRLVL